MLTNFNNIWQECSGVNLQQTVIFLSLHMHGYSGEVYYTITSRDATENDATCKVSKYQLISQP